MKIKIGEIIGYIFGYFIFTTILYFILVLLKKIPEDWDYFYVVGITLIIMVVGITIKKLLK